MDKVVLQGAVLSLALILLTLPGRGVRAVSPYLYHARRPPPAAQNTHQRPDGVFALHSAWDFPYQFEKYPVISKRKLETKVVEPCIGDAMDVTQQQSRRDLLWRDSGAMTPGPRLPGQQRPLMWDPWWTDPFTDPRLKILEVVAVYAVKVVMSTAFASWVLVAGQVLFIIADITGSSDIFGNRSPLTYIFQALPWIDKLLKDDL